MRQTKSPTVLQPLDDLQTVSLDLETTSLDVRKARIIQVGVVALRGADLVDQPSLNRLVSPNEPLSETTKRITGLSDDQLSGAPAVDTVLADLDVALDGQAVIGHNIAYDLAVLRAESKRVGLSWRAPVALDVGHLAGALDPALANLGFEALADALNSPVHSRHTAWGDAMTVAGMYQRLLPRLQAVGVRTLAQATALADKHAGRRQAEVAAGWHDLSSDRMGSRDPLRIDGVAFRHRVGDVMSAPPIFIPPDATPRAAAASMVENKVGALLVGQSTEPPLGIVTERDILRLTAEPTSLGSIAAAMNHPVHGITTDEFLYRALARMDGLGVRHLAVRDASGIAVGMISQRDLLAHRARSELSLGDAIDRAESSQALAMEHARLPSLSKGLIADGLNGLEIAAVISRELRALTARAATIAAQDIGPAPAPWCLMVLGSGGRGESLLAADQDNAVIHGDAGEDNTWFEAFGARIADILQTAGVPRCKGGVMASNNAWRGTPRVWGDRVQEWLGRARPRDLLNIDIFFDVRPVAGDQSLAENLHHNAILAAKQDKPFLGLLAQSVEAFIPRFSLLGGLPTENGRVDLKRQGLLSLVSFARALALAEGIGTRGTADRLKAVADRGRISPIDADFMCQVHQSIMTHVLTQQIADMEQGLVPTNQIPLSALRPKERTELKRDLKRVATIIGDIRALMV